MDIPESPHSSNSSFTSDNTSSDITAGPAQKFHLRIILPLDLLRWEWSHTQ